MLCEANGPHLCLLFVFVYFLSDVRIMDRNIRAVYLEVRLSCTFEFGSEEERLLQANSWSVITHF